LDLKLAGHLAHNNMLASSANIDSSTMSIYTDIILALHWTKKGLTFTSIPAAYLLRLQALHQQHYCYHCTTAHIVATANVMADNCSRLWHLSNKQLLTNFNLHYPQNLLWQQCTLWSEIKFALLSTLQGSNNCQSCSFYSYKNRGMVAYLTGKMYKVGNYPNPRS
jgi:hypothetical protein